MYYNFSKTILMLLLCFSGFLTKANLPANIIISGCYQNLSVTDDGGIFNVVPNSNLTFHSTNVLDFNSFAILNPINQIVLGVISDGGQWWAGTDPFIVVPLRPSGYAYEFWGTTTINPLTPVFAYVEATPDDCVQFGEAIDFSSMIAPYPGLCSFEWTVEDTQLGVLGQSGNGVITIDDNGFCDDDPNYDPTQPHCNTVDVKLTFHACVIPPDPLCAVSVDYINPLTVCCGSCDPFGASPPVLKRNLNEEESSESPQLEHTLNIYPNPANESIFIQTKTEKEQVYTLQLFDLMGKKVLSETINGADNTRLELNTGSVSSGTYILSVTTQDGSIDKSHRIVIMNK